MENTRRVIAAKICNIFARLTFSSSWCADIDTHNRILKEMRSKYYKNFIKIIHIQPKAKITKIDYENKNSKYNSVAYQRVPLANRIAFRKVHMLDTYCPCRSCYHQRRSVRDDNLINDTFEVLAREELLDAINRQ